MKKIINMLKHFKNEAENADNLITIVVPNGHFDDFRLGQCL